MLFGQSLITLVAVATSLVEAHPHSDPKEVTKSGKRGPQQGGSKSSFGIWRAAKQGDLRSPCPALNAAANLGVLYVLYHHGAGDTATDLSIVVHAMDRM
jgi:hypothetical protein